MAKEIFEQIKTAYQEYVNDKKIYNAKIDEIKIVSTYSKNAEINIKNIKHTQELINNSKILYINPNKKRTKDWLASNRLQLPFPPTDYGSINKITYKNDFVKNSIRNNSKNNDNQLKNSIDEPKYSINPNFEIVFDNWNNNLKRKNRISKINRN